MMPLIGRQRPFRLYAQCVIEPALNEVDLQLACFEDDAVAFALLGVGQPRQNRSSLRALRVDPRGEREPVVKAEIPDVTSVDEPRAVELDSLSDAPRGVSRLATFEFEWRRLLTRFGRAIERRAERVTAHHGPVR